MVLPFCQEQESTQVYVVAFVDCYSGFGNAAGLLAQYGLMSGPRDSATVYSSDSDSETEEYKELEPDVNPVTGYSQRNSSPPPPHSRIFHASVFYMVLAVMPSHICECKLQ